MTTVGATPDAIAPPCGTATTTADVGEDADATAIAGGTRTVTLRGGTPSALAPPGGTVARTIRMVPPPTGERRGLGENAAEQLIGGDDDRHENDNARCCVGDGIAPSMFVVLGVVDSGADGLADSLDCGE